GGGCSGSGGLREQCSAPAVNVGGEWVRMTRDGCYGAHGARGDEACARIVANGAARGIVEHGARRGVMCLPPRRRGEALRGVSDRRSTRPQRLEDQEQSGTEAQATAAWVVHGHVILTARALGPLARAYARRRRSMRRSCRTGSSP